MGQLKSVIRDKFLVNAIGLNKIMGQPFKVREVIQAIDNQLESPPSASATTSVQVNA